MRVEAQAAALRVTAASIKCIAEGRGGLSRPAEAEHALRPGFAGELVGFPARLSSSLGRHADRGAVEPIAGFGAHRAGECDGQVGVTSR